MQRTVPRKNTRSFIADDIQQLAQARALELGLTMHEYEYVSALIQEDNKLAMPMNLRNKYPECVDPSAIDTLKQLKQQYDAKRVHDAKKASAIGAKILNHARRVLQSIKAYEQQHSKLPVPKTPPGQDSWKTPLPIKQELQYLIDEIEFDMQDVITPQPKFHNATELMAHLDSV